MPMIVLQYLFLRLIELGLGSPALRAVTFTAAVLLRVGFHGLMRPAELLGMLRGDVLLSLEGEPAHAVIALRRPKNRGHMGKTQFRMCHDPATVAWLKWLLDELPPWS